jgi:hypothetical protein
VDVSSRIRGRRTLVATLAATLMAMVLGGPPAGAETRPPAPQVTHDPEISGQPYVGTTLTAVNGAYTPASATATYLWYRCEDPSTFDCQQVAEGQSYVVAESDLGRQLAVVLLVSDGRHSDWAASQPTAAITHKPPPPPPPPTPSPSPAPTPPPIAAPPPPPPTTTGGVAGVHEQALRFLSPFPIVRIKGWLTSSGARVTMLTVRAPRGSKISVRCRGTHCPRKQLARATRLVHLKPYERLLRGNMRLEISVTRRGFVGKRTVIVLRRGKAPTRRDLCLYPGVSRAKSCTAT